MACDKITVCHNTRCKNQGAALVIQDIEELVQGSCKVEKCGCLGKCGEGPNVEIVRDEVPVIHTGLVSFQKILNLVDDEAAIDVPADVAKIGHVKYEARQMSDADERLKMIEEGIKKIDKELAKSENRPKLMADMLVMRSRTLLSTQPQQALGDAEEAVKLAPGWAQSLLALAVACETTKSPIIGLKAAQDALKTGMCFDRQEARKLVARLKPLAQEENDDPEKYRQLRSQIATARKSTVLTAGSPQGPLPIAKAPTEYTSNIYHKFGGRPKFKDLAYAVHNAMFKHPATKDFFPPTMDNSRITERNVDFLVGAFGGPKYQGPDMMVTHEFLRITDHQYDVMMDCYKDAIANMKIQDMFSVPILRQLEGMRSSIVYSKNRPPPLARKFDHYLDSFKEKKLEVHKKPTKDKAKSKTVPQSQESEAKPEPKTDAKAAAAPKAKAKARGNTAPSGKKVRSSVAVGAQSEAAVAKDLLDKGTSDASTALASSYDKDSALDADISESKATISASRENTAASGAQCPVSGRTVEKADAEGTCPFFALLNAPGASPGSLSLLQSLKDGRVSLANPDAEQSSPNFGLVSM